MMDRRCSGFNAHELKPLDSCREPGGIICALGSTPIGSSDSTNVQHAERTCLAFRKEPRRVRFESCPLGWTHRSGSFEATVRTEANGEEGAALDAPVGIPAEASQLILLFLPSSPDGTGQAISEGVKKNLRSWIPRKP